MAVRSVFDRPMFRNPNVNFRRNMPSGIMASGPQLILASAANANPLLTGGGNQISDMITSIKPVIGEDSTINRDIFGNLIAGKGAGVTGTDVRRMIDEPSGEEEKEKIVGAIPGTTSPVLTDIKPSIDTASEKITKKNEELLKDSGDPDVEDISGDVETKSLLDAFKKNNVKNNVETENVETPDKNISKESDKTGGSTTLNKELNLTNEMIARNRTALTDMASLEDKEFFGTTANKVTQELFNEYDKEGKEVTLADVRDKGIKILGFDPDKLEENFDEDRRSALFLRIIQAGLAVAAGESENALTNVAKGLSVGLAGYGDDVKFLSKEMKADRREAANTMYRLLGDAKSEQLAKEALNLQKKVAQQQIVSSKVGQERNNLLKELELKNANASLKLNFYSAMREQNFKEKKFQIEQDQFDKSLNATLQKIPSQDLRTLYDAGLVKLKDERKGLIPGNYTVAPEGRKILIGVVKDEFGGDVLAKQRQSLEQKILSEEGRVKGIVMGEGFDKKSFGVKADAFVTKFNKLKADDDPMAITLDYLDLAQEVNGKIKLSQVPLIIQQELLRPPSTAQKNRGETGTLLEKYANRFDENDEMFKREFNL